MTLACLKAVTRFLHRVAAKDAHGLTDQELLDRFTRYRDEAAFADLVRRHGPMVLGVCRRVLRHEHDAEDAFQAAFLVLVRKAGSLRQRAAVGGWLFRVAYRLALRARAGGARRERPTDPADLSLAAAEARGDPLPSLDEEVQRLPEQYRSAAVLCYVEGRTQAEAARLLRTTAEAVNSRLKRARDLLRRRLGRRGLLLSSGAAGVLGHGEAATAAVSPDLVRLTARTAVRFAADPGASGASALAVTLARGALRTMMTMRLKLLSLLALTLALLTAGALALPVPALGDDPPKGVSKGKTPDVVAPDKEPPPRPGKPVRRRACIILWMSGGPSQFETFDLKPNRPTGGPFRTRKTATKGLEISEHLPKLAQLTDHLAIIRSLTHREGDHQRATYLMRTGHSPDGQTDYPSLGCVLGKELGKAQGLPRYVRIGGPSNPVAHGYGPGYLGLDCAPVVVGGRGFGLAEPESVKLPPAEDFEPHAKGRGAQMRKAVAKAFDLAEEKPAVRDAYGQNPFGQSCLLARRLVERGVPVVEVSLGGWDTHANAFESLKKLSAKLDSGWGSLLKDLKERKLLDDVLIVWMGEFGRTPRINPQQGRDHWPFSSCVVLGGRGIKGGQAVGKTDADGMKVAERPVSPAELLATIYQALGIDATRTYRSNQGQDVPLVEKGTKAVREALR
jgi:RNA polymerase sigma factor (sigma-70 family)